MSAQYDCIMRTEQGEARERARKAAHAAQWQREARAREAQQGIVPVSVKAHVDDRAKVRQYAAKLLKQRGLG